MKNISTTKVASFDDVNRELDRIRSLLRIIPNYMRDVDGDKSIFGLEPNYTEIETDGTVIAHGEATMYNDLYLDVSPKTTGVGKPTLATFKGNINKYTFAVNDITEVNTQEILHDWEEGTPIEVHVHWATAGNNDTTTRGVKWEVDYSIANTQHNNINIVFPDVTTISAEGVIAPSEIAYTHKYTSIGTINMTGYKIGACMTFSLKRIASVANVAPANNPFGLMLGLHYKRNSLGSRTISSK